MRSLRSIPRKSRSALGPSRCKRCGITIVTAPGLTSHELGARLAGYCDTECEEEDHDD